MSLKTTAIHEAGHAVAYRRLHADAQAVGAVSVVADEESLGHAIGPGERSIWNAEYAEAVVMSLCSGYAAVLVAGYAEEEAVLGCGSDFERAGDLIAEWGLGGDLEAWKFKAAELMRRPENVAGVALVAEHLLRHQRLEADFVDVLLEYADGDCSPEDFAQYLAIRKLLARDVEGG